MRNSRSLWLKTFGITVALFAVLAISTAVLAAAPYPSKPVRLIVPMTPGGGTDIIARVIAAQLSERLGKQVVVENHAGGGTVIGTELVAKADPDGYTLLFTPSSHTIKPVLEKVPYDPIKSFAPIARVGTGQNSLVVHPSVPANSVKELIALAKQKPGKLIFGSPGIGGTMHMGAELFKIMAEIDFKIVHFKGAAPATVDLLGGHSHGFVGSILQNLPHIKSGQLRVLGTGGVKRSVFLPDVPTIAEAGLPGYQSLVWWGMHAPAGTPAPIVDRLSKELKAILLSDEVKKQFLNQGAEVDYQDPTEFGKFIEIEMTQWARVVKNANIKLEQ